jgi:hypothetical protein
MEQYIVQVNNASLLLSGSELTTESALLFISNQTQIHDCYLIQGNKILQPGDKLSASLTIHVHLRLRGGKGGFGTMLKTQAPRRKINTNYESCRDINGRRLRNVLNEKRLELWGKIKEEEKKVIDAEMKSYHQQRNELEAAIKANVYKLDDQYKKQVVNTSNLIVEGVTASLKRNRKTENLPPNKKKLLEYLK